MASYEDGAVIDSGTLDSVISDAVASDSISKETAAAIQDLVNSLGTDATAQTVAAGTALDQAAAAEVTAPIVIMNTDSKADVTFAADSPVKAIVVGGAGDSNVTFETNDAVTVQLQGGQGDSVSTGAGNDAITFTGGSATVDTGEGNDTVVLQGGEGGAAGEASVTMGSGNGTISVQGMVGTATIDAGDGFDQVHLVSSRLAHVFSFINGLFHMHSDAQLQMQNVNVVAFDSLNDGTVDQVAVLADSAGDSITAKLYQVAFGREALDGADGTNGLTGEQAVTGVLGGISYWTSVFDQGTNTGADLQHTVYSFLNCEEFHSKYDSMSNEQFVQTLLDNLGAANDTTVTTVNGLTAADLVAQLNGTDEARYNVAWTVASSQEAVHILGQATDENPNGINFVIDGFEGSCGPTA